MGFPRVRYRTNRFTSIPYSFSVFNSMQNAGVLTPIDSLEVTADESNPPSYRKAGQGKWDIGSPWDNRKFQLEIDETQYRMNAYYYGGSLGWQYSQLSPIVPAAELAPYLDPTLVSDLEKAHKFARDRGEIGYSVGELNALGTLAIGVTKPTDPGVDMLTSMAELVAERKLFGIPGKAGSLSGEYLNYAFGIAPVTSTAKDLRDAINNADKIVDQYRRDSGKWVRRQLEFDEEVSERELTTNGVYPLVPAGVQYHLVEPGTLTQRTRTTINSKFSGAFLYHIPEGAIPKRAAELDVVYGVQPGVSVGWELLPYSWLVDYLTPVGQMLAYADDYRVHGLILPYAYISAHTREVTEYHWTGRIRDASGEWQHRTVSATLTRERKNRIRATPFGFGLLPGGFNAKQWAILAALGLNRATGGRI